MDRPKTKYKFPNTGHLDTVHAKWPRLITVFAIVCWTFSYFIKSLQLSGVLHSGWIYKVNAGR